MIRHSPAPFILEYSCFEDQHGNEIPSFRIYDADGDVVAETDSGKPADQQESDAYLLAAAPELLDALQTQTDAAQDVLDNWERGDLAAAVRALAATLAASRAAVRQAKGGVA